MLVANSFDLWQKDTFFSAAEEVQKSADIMESAYRTWLRARKEGSMPQYLDELGRELQMALGTAKWQLEEFEKAVRLSYRKHVDDITITRHRQFVSALEDQISHVEAALKESFNVEGRKPFRWVNLDKEECDDFAFFLSGTPGTSQTIKDEGIKLEAMVSSSFSKKKNVKEDCSLGLDVGSRMQIPNHGRNLEVVTGNEPANCFMEIEERKFIETGDKIICQTENISSDLRIWSPCQIPPDRSALEVVIDCDDRQKHALIEATPKEKGSKPSFWRSRCEGDPGAKGGVLSHTQWKIINWMNEQLRGGQRSQRQLGASTGLPVNSLRFVLGFMLTIFLVVPFLLYST